MRFAMFLSLLLGLSFSALSGCGDQSTESPGGETKQQDDHHHAGDDKLFWQRRDIEHEGYTILLGHHG